MKECDFVVVIRNNNGNELCKEGYRGLRVGNTYRMGFENHGLYRLYDLKGETNRISIDNLRPATSEEVISYIKEEIKILKRDTKDTKYIIDKKRNEILKYK